MLQINKLEATAVRKPMLKGLSLAIIASAPPASTASAAEPTPARSAERVAVERCVWDSVQQQLAAKNASQGMADPQWDIGREAADICAAQIRRWAETSPAVLEVGDDVDELEEMMILHYSARGSLFAEGKAKPFFMTDQDKSSAALAQ